MDYRRPIKFGCFVIPDATVPLQALENAVRADERIDLIGIHGLVVGGFPDDTDGLKRFLDEVAPRVRELVASARA